MRFPFVPDNVGFTKSWTNKCKAKLITLGKNKQQSSNSNKVCAVCEALLCVLMHLLTDFERVAR